MKVPHFTLIKGLVFSNNSCVLHRISTCFIFIFEVLNKQVLIHNTHTNLGSMYNIIISKHQKTVVALLKRIGKKGIANSAIKCIEFFK